MSTTVDQQPDLEQFQLWTVMVGVQAMLTYQAYPVGDGVAAAAGQREMLVRLTMPVAIYAPSKPFAQSLVFEVLAGFSSAELLAGARIFALGGGGVPDRRNVVSVRLLDVDDLVVIDVEQIG
jgi:hypothetical protein